MMAERRFILALAGGVGGGKFARGLIAVLPPEQLALVVNTGDDFVHLGLNVSPDLDSVMYAAADLNDRERGWGLAGESWNFMDAIRRLGGADWFQIGDRDLATHVLRTEQVRAGRSLSEITRLLCRRLGVRHAIVPMTEAPVRTRVATDEGVLPFQDYFVRRRCEPIFRGVTFEGIEQAAPSAGFHEAISRADAVLIAPSNPFVSIDPILAVPGVREALAARGAPVIAVSPMVGGRSVKGPLGKMMGELGLELSPLGVARHYAGLVQGWVIDRADERDAPSIEQLGCRVAVTDTIMHDLDDKARVAEAALSLAAFCGRAAGAAA